MVEKITPSEVLNVYAYVAKQNHKKGRIVLFQPPSARSTDTPSPDVMPATPTARETGPARFGTDLHHLATFGDRGGNAGTSQAKKQLSERSQKRQKMRLSTVRVTHTFLEMFSKAYRKLFQRT